MLEKLKIIRELSTLFSGTDVYLMPNTEPELRSYLSQTLSPKLGIDLTNHPAVRQLCTLDSQHIYEFLPLPGIAALAYHCPKLNKILFAGPVTTESYNTRNFRTYLQQQGLSAKAITQLTTCASSLPSLPKLTFHRFMAFLLQQLCETDIPVPIRQAEPQHDFAPPALFYESHPSKDAQHILQIENRYKTSSLLTEAVKLGNFSLAAQCLNAQQMLSDMPVRSKNPLRNMQNYCIILNTQLRHSLEGSGIHPYKLDQLSHDIGLQIEQLSNPNTLPSFASRIIEQYCHLVQEYSYPDLSPLTHQAVMYIKNNLGANLTVKDTAKVLSVHPDYLSHQFSREMGMTFIAFLNRERCRQAASYLKHTNLQIKQISAVVGFNTISYFTKQFTHFYGQTPRDFRNERIIRKKDQ